MGGNGGDRRERGAMRGGFRVFAKRKCMERCGFSIRKWGFRVEFDLSMINFDGILMRDFDG